MQSETETKAPVVKRTIPKKQMGFLAVAKYAMQHPDKNFAEIFKLKESPDAICDHVKNIIDDAELAKSVNELRKKLIAKPRKQAALSEAAKEIVELARSNDMATATATATTTATASKKRKAAPKKHPTTPDVAAPDVAAPDVAAPDVATHDANQSANASIQSSVVSKKRKAASADGEAPKPKSPRKAKVQTTDKVQTQTTDNVVADAVVTNAVVTDA